MFIDENFITSAEVENIKNLVFGDNFPWYLNTSTALEKENYPSNQVLYEKNNNMDDIQFVHILYNNFLPVSNVFDPFYSIFVNFCSKNNINVKAILRAKLNLTVSNGEKDFLSSVHVDYPFDHSVFLYYINDSDGDTVFYKEKYDGSGKKDLNIEKRVTPKAGKAVLFNGLKYHAPISPISSRYRSVLNISFL